MDSISKSKNNGCQIGQVYNSTSTQKCSSDTISDKLIENNNRGVRFLLEAQYTVDVLNFEDTGNSNSIVNPEKN